MKQRVLDIEVLGVMEDGHGLAGGCAVGRVRSIVAIRRDGDGVQRNW